jgi:hypothetical protein
MRGRDRSTRAGAKRARQIGSGALALGATLAAAQSADAATFNVTNLNDAGAGSLRQAVLNANAAAGLDQITFQTGLTGTITLTGGQIQITDSVQIQGPGAATLAVSGNDASRIFYVYDTVHSAPADVTISALTITHGSSGNNSLGGGALAAVGERLTLDDVVISDSAGEAGAGISFYGGVSLSDNTPAGAALMTIRKTTIRGNTASGRGGGISVGFACGSVIENSTLADNVAASHGGGIYIGSGLASTPCVDIRHTTISGNSANKGGSLYIQYSNARLDHSILANSLPAGSDEVAMGTTYYFPDVFTSYSLVESGAAVLIDQGGNVFNQDPQLGALQNNGGPTPTFKPAPTSPAVNAGNPAFAPPPATDQRGLPRVAGGRVDIGSVELQPSTLQFAVAAQSFNETAGTVTLSVTRSGSDGAASVQVTATGGTATGGGTDYTFGGATLNWADNDAAPKTFTINITNDSIFEGGETIILQLANPTGAAIGTPAADVVTLTDSTAPIPALSPSMQVLLAALIAALGVGLIRKS